jgi:hypothetical protein
VVVGGRKYALLDGTNPNDGNMGCQNGGALMVPAGWSLAPEDATSAAAAAAYPFGAAVVLVATGNGYRTTAWAPAGWLVTPATVGVPVPSLLAGTPGTGYGPVTCSMRVLIYQ